MRAFPVSTHAEVLGLTRISHAEDPANPALKLAYLTRAPPYFLVQLLMTIDYDRSTPIFPPNLESVMTAMLPVQPQSLATRQARATAHTIPLLSANVQAQPSTSRKRTVSQPTPSPVPSSGVTIDLNISTKFYDADSDRGRVPSYEEMCSLVIEELNEPEGSSVGDIMSHVAL